LRLTARIGRPTVPIESYLRLMYLKYRYSLGYETLCREVADDVGPDLVRAAAGFLLGRRPADVKHPVVRPAWIAG